MRHRWGAPVVKNHMSAWLFALMALTAPQTSGVSDHENELFKKNCGLYLTRDSWNDALAYLHGEFLMVPLHAAFLLDQPDWRAQYEAQFKRLVKVPHDKLCKNPLSRLQYLYLTTRYLALEAKTGRTSSVDADLTSYVTDEIVDRWLYQDAIAFDHSPFHGVKDRIQHKMSLVNPAKSHYAAITDEELFLFAEAADMLYVERKTGRRNPDHDNLTYIVHTGASVIRDRSEWTAGGGWLFDVGKWADHPDLAYAGNGEITPAISQHRVSNITMDTSHFHRVALFVNSWRDAYSPDSPDYNFFEKVRKGLARQMDSVVLKKPTSDFPGYRVTNFMNGMNGVYRYNSADDVGRDKGYGPFQLSGTFLMGWWSFTGDPVIKQAYGDMAKMFPLPETLLMTYQGPVYKPAPRKDKSWYENGLAELFCSLGSKMPGL